MREAEHTRLLASSHDATSAASSSGSVWSRVALGLGTLGVIAAVAALATSPETLMDITLGLGLSLPRETPAQHGLSTKSIRPVASGDGTRPHSALRTEDALVPKLGSHKSGVLAAQCSARLFLDDATSEGATGQARLCHHPQDPKP